MRIVRQGPRAAPRVPPSSSPHQSLSLSPHGPRTTLTRSKRRVAIRTTTTDADAERATALSPLTPPRPSAAAHAARPLVLSFSRPLVLRARAPPSRATRLSAHRATSSRAASSRSSSSRAARARTRSGAPMRGRRAAAAFLRRTRWCRRARWRRARNSSAAAAVADSHTTRGALAVRALGATSGPLVAF